MCSLFDADTSEEHQTKNNKISFPSLGLISFFINSYEQYQDCSCFVMIIQIFRDPRNERKANKNMVVIISRRLSKPGQTTIIKLYDQLFRIKTTGHTNRII